MSRWFPTLALLAAPTVAGAEEPPAAPLSFAIRAITEIAPQVNGVLQEIAEPAGVAVPQSIDPAVLLSRRCGGHAPTIIKEEVALDPGQKIVFYKPCALFRQTKRAIVPGTNLGALAQSSGLRAIDWIKAKVTDGSGNEVAVKPNALPDKGFVTFDLTPVWTDITVKPDVITSRAQLIEHFAKVLDCDGKADLEKCVGERGFAVLNASITPAAPREMPSATFRPSRRWSVAQDITSHNVAGRHAAMPVALFSFAQIADQPRQAFPVPAPALQLASSTIAPVAAAQWPYDPALIAATLTEAGKRGWIGDNVPTTIGVADVGLADPDGLPFAPLIFSRNSREAGTVDGDTGAEPNNFDDDENGFDDDFYGAGERRAAGLAKNGDLALCGSRTIALSALEGKIGETADHGSIVASIAAGLPFRNLYEGRGLPKLIFYRLLPQACGEGAAASATEAAAVSGLDYLYRRSSLAVLSFTLAGETKTLDKSIRSLLAAKDRLLILPAGNDQPGNIDEYKPMPAYLGNRDDESNSWRRIIVVGAAQRDLGIASYSGWGVDTVWLYAPGEPFGAIRVNGHAVADSPARSATSFAAPFVGLAAGMMRAQGMTDVAAIRQRLLLATWPIDAKADKVDVRRAGVLDLHKAAAVRLTSVELVEEKNGALQRSTIVGSFVKPLPGTAICSSAPFLRMSKIQAIRLSDPRPGERDLTITEHDKTNSGALPTPRQCEPAGTFSFADVRGQTIQVDLTRTTAILFPWQPAD